MGRKWQLIEDLSTEGVRRSKFPCLGLTEIDSSQGRSLPNVCTIHFT